MGKGGVGIQGRVVFKIQKTLANQKSCQEFSGLLSENPKLLEGVGGKGAQVVGMVVENSQTEDRQKVERSGFFFSVRL